MSELIIQPGAGDDSPLAICIMGPTATGKTELAMAIHQALPVELISVDSAMVYRELNIGSAKPTPAELARAPHRLIDIVDASERYSAGRFRDDALAEMRAITALGRIPLLVGGTMLYFNALQQGIAELPLHSGMPLRIAFFGGAVMGLAVASLGLFGLGIFYFIFAADAVPGTNDLPNFSEIIAGFAMVRDPVLLAPMLVIAAAAVDPAADDHAVLSFAVHRLFDPDDHVSSGGQLFESGVVGRSEVRRKLHGAVDRLAGHQQLLQRVQRVPLR